MFFCFGGGTGGGSCAGFWELFVLILIYFNLNVLIVLQRCIWFLSCFGNFTVAQ